MIKLHPLRITLGIMMRTYEIVDLGRRQPRNHNHVKVGHRAVAGRGDRHNPSPIAVSERLTQPDYCVKAFLKGDNNDKIKRKETSSAFCQSWMS